MAHLVVYLILEERRPEVGICSYLWAVAMGLGKSRTGELAIRPVER